MVRRLGLGLAGATLTWTLLGCASSNLESTDARSPTNPEQVEVVTGEPRTLFSVIQELQINVPQGKPSNGDAAVEELKISAAQVGADAIMDVRSEIWFQGKVVAAASEGTPEWNQPMNLQLDFKALAASGITVADVLSGVRIVYSAKAIRYRLPKGS